MRLLLTPAVERAFTDAQALARGEPSPQVSPLHLLAGLLREEEGQAADLARQAGLDLEAWRRTTWPPADGPGVAISPELEGVLDRARELALERTGERMVGSDVVLLALVEVPDLADRLAEAGMEVARLRTALHHEREEPAPIEEGVRLTDVTERMDTARVLDASANRAREALRVLEDHARFVLEDAFLTESLKSVRHELTQALLEHGLPLTEARDTQGDVGTAIQTDAEYQRLTLRDVVAAAGKRLGEALRSLEEYGKLAHPLLGERVERLRYRHYTLEKALTLLGRSRAALAEARLYVLLTGSACESSLEWTIEQAAAGGAAVIQLREKALSDRDLLARARDVRRWTRKAGVLFIMNDRVDIARLADADGVHLGQDDLPVREARRVLGPEALIGVSTHTPDQVRQAVLDGASYLGVGPTFPSGTKAFEAFPGLDFIRESAAITSLPMFAIGGINETNVAQAVAAGARRVAVSQAIAAADEPRDAAAALLRALPR